jgi:hypothetical protein
MRRRRIQRTNTERPASKTEPERRAEMVEDG